MAALDAELHCERAPLHVDHASLDAVLQLKQKINFICDKASCD